MDEPLWSCLVICHQPGSLLDNRIRNNVEYTRGERTPIGETAGTLKGVPVVPNHPCRHQGNTLLESAYKGKEKIITLWDFYQYLYMT